MSGFVVHLMRHGAPATPGLLLGRTDMPPTRAGVDACVAQVVDLSFGAIVASDLQRCALTAAEIGAMRGMPSVVDPRWRELDFGDWDGLAPSQLDGDALGAFWDDPDANPPLGGERWSSLVARVASAIDAIAADASAGDTLVVTHGGAIRAALASLFGFEQRQLWSFALPYAAVVSLRIWPGSPRTAQIVGLWA